MADNRPDLSDWQAGDALSAAKLSAPLPVVRTVQSITGGRGIVVTQSPAGTTISLASEGASNRAVPVYLTTNTSDAGKVNAKRFDGSGVNTSGALANSNLGTVASSDDAIVWDLSKLNGAIRLGHYVGATDSGKPILVVDDRGLFPVRIVNDGGSQGTKTTPASWTYTVKHLDNNRQIGTGVTLARSRPNGTATNSSLYGFGFYDGATFKLWDAGELYGTGGC